MVLMHLELDPKHRQFIESKVRAGEFGSPEAVVAAAIAQAKRGELLDADDVFDEIERRIDSGDRCRAFG
jgi:Arc/MetJ-type ribon-helix-helix transcriptional regulator